MTDLFHKNLAMLDAELHSIIARSESIVARQLAGQWFSHSLLANLLTHNQFHHASLNRLGQFAQLHRRIIQQCYVWHDYYMIFLCNILCQ